MPNTPNFSDLPKAGWVQPYIDASSPLSIVVTDPEDPKQLNGCIITWIEIYQEGYFDRQLLFTFQEDFADWTEANFGKVYPPIAKRLKDFLKLRGIYVGNVGDDGKVDRRKAVPQQLAALLDDDIVKSPKWPKDDLDEMRMYNKDFKSYVYNPGFENDDETSQNRKTAKDDSDDEKDPSVIPTWAQGTTTDPNGVSKALTDLGKLYQKDQDKFGAKHYEVLENKLRIFFDNTRDDLVPWYLVVGVFICVSVGRTKGRICTGIG